MCRQTKKGQERKVNPTINIPSIVNGLGVRVLGSFSLNADAGITSGGISSASLGSTVNAGAGITSGEVWGASFGSTLNFSSGCPGGK